MSKRTAANILFLSVLVVASQLLAACSRIVSVDPLLADAPPSREQWQGAYVGTMDPSEKHPFAMLLQLRPGSNGGYEFTIHARDLGQDVFTGPGPLNLVGRGEARIADLGDGFAVAQTRCEIGIPPRADFADKYDALAAFLQSAKRMGAMSEKVPQSKYVGPYVYSLIRGGPSRPQTILGLDGVGPIAEAARGTPFAVDKWEGGIGDGVLIGAGLMFEGDDIHLARQGGQGPAQALFAKLARKLFAEQEVKNSIAWTRVEPDRLRTLPLNDNFPERRAAWCNLMFARPSD